MKLSTRFYFNGYGGELRLEPECPEALEFINQNLDLRIELGRLVATCWTTNFEWEAPDKFVVLNVHSDERGEDIDVKKLEERYSTIVKYMKEGKQDEQV